MAASGGGGCHKLPLWRNIRCSCSWFPVHSLPPFLLKHGDGLNFLWGHLYFIFLLLELVFPEKIVFALGLNLINVYPWEDVSGLILLLGLPRDTAGELVWAPPPAQPTDPIWTRM